MYEVWNYLTPDGKDTFADWFRSLADKKARARISTRIDRLEQGNFGDCKPLREGVWELRIDFGPGYRIYYAIAERTIVLLLCGGDKRKQAADIERAVEYWSNYKKRTEKP